MSVTCYFERKGTTFFLYNVIKKEKNWFLVEKGDDEGIREKEN